MECFLSPLSAHWTPVPLRRGLRRKLRDLLQPLQSSIPLECWLINDSAVSFRQIARYCNQSVASDRLVIKAAKQSKPLARADLQKRRNNNCTGRSDVHRLAASVVGKQNWPRADESADSRRPFHLTPPYTSPNCSNSYFRPFFCSSFITHQEEWKKQRKWKNIIWQFS